MKYFKILFLVIAIVVISINQIDVAFATGQEFSSKSSGDTCENRNNSKTTIQAYVVPYMGDIDGGVAPVRFAFYDKVVEFHNTNSIPTGLSFYPGTLNGDSRFLNSIVKMYNSKNIDLIQKGFMGDEIEARMADLPIEKQREIIKAGQDRFVEVLSSRIGTDEIYVPRFYNQIQGSINQDTIEVLESLGFEQYFDVFETPGLDVLKDVDNFLVIRYGISFPENSNTPGYRTTFKSVDEIVNQIKTYRRSDIDLLKIDCIPVIPLWSHQQDFLNISNLSEPDKNKWEIYTETLLRLDADPTIKLIKPSDISDALNLSDNEILPVTVKATVLTDKELSCEAPVSSSFNVPKEVNITDPNPIICKSFDINMTGLNFSINLETPCNFLKLQFGFSIPKPEVDVKYDNATTSFIYEHIVRNSDIVIEDYTDECIESVWLENPTTKEKRSIEFEEVEGNLVAQVPENFSFNKISITSCSNETMYPDEPLICNSNFPEKEAVENVEICSWKGCKKGAISITVDDHFTACMGELEEYGYRGTYYLANTNNYTEELWDEFRRGHEAGHEIGTHTQSHLCVEQGVVAYREDIDRNIQDIMTNLGVEREEIVSHSYPCGFTTSYKQKIIEDAGLLSARNYNINKLESQTPGNYFNLNSYNDEDYPGGKLNVTDYIRIIDDAQDQNKWAILSFHSYCNDKGVIEYLAIKNMWIDTVGNIVKYTHLRDNTTIEDYSSDDSAITFRLESDSELKGDNHSQSLSLKVRIHQGLVNTVLVNEEPVSYSWTKDFAGEYIQFDVMSPTNSMVEIRLY